MRGVGFEHGNPHTLPFGIGVGERYKNYKAPWCVKRSRVRVGRSYVVVQVLIFQVQTPDTASIGVGPDSNTGHGLQGVFPGVILHYAYAVV